MVPLAHAGDGGGSIRIPASHVRALRAEADARPRLARARPKHEAWAGLVHAPRRHAQVRDSAAVLDVLQGYMTGDWYTAPPPARPYARRGRRRAGQAAHRRAHDRAARASPSRPRVRRRGRGHRARCSKSLGHTRRSRGTGRARRRRAARDVHHRDACRRCAPTCRGRRPTIGRPVTADDVEPSTWAHTKRARRSTRGDYVDALAKMQELGTAHRRRGGPTTASTSCSRRRCAEPPPGSATSSGPETGGARAAAVRDLHRAVQRHRPARDVGAAAHRRRRACRSACSSSARPYREDVLIRVAAQLEQATPWADRRPPLHA